MSFAPNALQAIEPGPHVTLQDSGRHGWRRFGVSGSGAMDPASLAAANALVGNPLDMPVLEFAHVAGTWEVAADSLRFAVAGGDFAIAIDSLLVAAWRSHIVRRGQRFSIASARDAVWGYLAVAGGFAVTPQLGSCSTHLRSGIGGIAGGRALAGDVVPLLANYAPEGPELHIAKPLGRHAAPLRVLLGPQDDYFSAEILAQFLAAPWRVTHRGDRMGTWLEGPVLRHVSGHDVVSDGLMPGCIQVPGAGQPVVLMMDCQTIGGYPKLATIITPDLPRFAQSQPGSLVNFTAIDIAQAQRLYRTYRTALDAVGSAVAPVADHDTRPFWLRR